jgi:hypothetical protein
MDREDSLVWMIIDYLLKWIKTPRSWVALGGTFLLIIVLGIVFSYQAGAFPSANPFNVSPPSQTPYIPDGAVLDTHSWNDQAVEGAPGNTDEYPLLGDRIYTLKVELKWTDEADAGRRFTNQPDRFELTVELPDGESKTEEAQGTNAAEGVATVDWNWTADGGANWADDEAGITNDITITVRCITAGDQRPLLSVLGFRERADDGNAYSVYIEYVYFEE